MKTGVKIAVSIIFINHLMCCFWYFQAKIQDYPAGCWVRDEGLIDSANSDKYLVSFYFIFQTLTTVGYGDITVGTETERIICIFIMIAGVGFYSYTIGNMTSII